MPEELENPEDLGEALALEGLHAYIEEDGLWITAREPDKTDFEVYYEFIAVPEEEDAPFFVSDEEFRRFQEETIRLHEELPHDVEQKLVKTDLEELPTGDRVDTEERLDVSRQLQNQGKVLHIPEKEVWVYGREKPVPDGSETMYYYVAATEDGEVEKLTIGEFNELLRHSYELQDEAPEHVEKQVKEL